MFVFASCHAQTPSVVVSVNGTDIPAGIYLMCQYEAFNSAANAYSEDQYFAGTDVSEDVDVLKATIDGVSGEEWINAETDRLLKQYVYATEAQAESSAVTDEEINAAKASALTMFDTYYSRELYEANGIGEQSYADHYVAQTIYYDLLSTYTEENKESVTVSDATAYMDENYKQINTLSLPVSTSAGIELDDAGKAEVQKIADTLVSDLAAGGDLDELASDALKAAFEVCGVEYSDEAIDQYKSTYYLPKEEVNYYFDYAFVQQVYSSSVGDSGQTVSGIMPMVYSVIPNYENEEAFSAEFYDGIASLLCQEEFEAMVEEEVAAYTIEEYGNARNSYSANKIVETV